MKVVFTGENFICRCSFAERHHPKGAGFRWSDASKEWITPSHRVAARLRRFADETAEKEISRVLLTNKPWSGRLLYPSHLELLAHQETAALFALARSRSYLGLDPGLGKTIVAAVVANSLGEEKRIIVYVCPPFLIPNVRAEFEKWGVSGEVYIVPDSKLDRYVTLDYMKTLKATAAGREIVLFVDEAHRFKNEDALRTRAIFRHFVPGADRVIFLSGTPMPNRPIELYPVLAHAAPETINFMNKFDFGRYYCNAHRSNFGWDFSGASHVEELASRVIGPFMLRIKKEVLNLPPKLEEMVVVSETLPPKLSEMNTRLLSVISPEDEMSYLAPNGHVSTYRKELGIEKVKPSLEFLRSILEETEESVLIFAIHKEVVSNLASGLAKYAPLVIDGSVDTKDRMPIADEFQKNPERRVLILNIQAGGIGFNLTKASRVVFVEYSWTPSDNDQASDRAHRIGQKGSVLVQYLVFKNSIDRSVMETIFRKKKITKHV